MLNRPDRGVPIVPWSGKWAPPFVAAEKVDVLRTEVEALLTAYPRMDYYSGSVVGGMCRYARAGFLTAVAQKDEGLDPYPELMKLEVSDRYRVIHAYMKRVSEP